MGTILDKFAKLINWAKAAYQLWIFGSALLTSVGAVIWAFFQEVPGSIIAMNASAMILCLLLVLDRMFEWDWAHNGPNYARWRRLERYSIAQASKLWVGMNPAGQLSSKQRARAAEVTHLLCDAIRQKRLPIAPEEDRHDIRFPQDGTYMTRADLIAYASTLGPLPRFLED